MASAFDRRLLFKKYVAFIKKRGWPSSEAGRALLNSEFYNENGYQGRQRSCARTAVALFINYVETNTLPPEFEGDMNLKKDFNEIARCFVAKTKEEKKPAAKDSENSEEQRKRDSKTCSSPSGPFPKRMKKHGSVTKQLEEEMAGVKEEIQQLNPEADRKLQTKDKEIKKLEKEKTTKQKKFEETIKEKDRQLVKMEDEMKEMKKRQEEERNRRDVVNIQYVDLIKQLTKKNAELEAANSRLKETVDAKERQIRMIVDMQETINGLVRCN